MAPADMAPMLRMNSRPENRSGAVADRTKHKPDMIVARTKMIVVVRSLRRARE
jgi:hypothetical protein